jgi:hypothetical protein
MQVQMPEMAPRGKGSHKAAILDIPCLLILKSANHMRKPLDTFREHVFVFPGEAHPKMS